nr:acyltransferase [Brucella intermedia]
MAEISLAQSSAKKVSKTTIGFQSNIQYTRAVAAFAVLLYHTGHYYKAVTGDGRFEFIFPPIYGSAGVAVFFAISGYLMARIALKQTATEFLFRRINRIYPTLIIATFCMFWLLSPAARAAYNPVAILLIPIGKTPYPLSVEWTLVHEMLFYIVIFFMILTGQQRRIPVLALSWLALLLLIYFSGFKYPSGVLQNIIHLPLMPANIGFTLGLLIPVALKFKIHWAVWLAGGATALLYAAKQPVLPMTVLSGFATASILTALLKIQLPIHGLAHSVFEKLGDWSYAIYLIHAPLMLLFFRQTHTVLSGWSAILGAVLFITVFASLLGVLDIRLHNITRNLSAHLSKRFLAVFSAVFLAIYFGVAIYYL